MAKVELKKPTIITIEFRQEKEDEDYGSCMWARFVLDTENYDMHITSDCGNYGYGWVPTPKQESFLKLLSRMDSEYLLGKIASMDTVDTEETYNHIKEYLEYISDGKTFEELDVDMQRIYAACTYSNKKDVVDSILSEIELSELEDEVSEFDLYENICMTYSASQKKIGEVFKKHIKPFLGEFLKGE